MKRRKIGSARKKKKGTLDIILGVVSKWILAVALIFFFLSMIQVIILRWVDPPTTVNMFWKWVVGDRPLSYYSLYNSWRPLNVISPHLRRAVIAGEDQRFMLHNGFDFKEMNKAIKDIAKQRGFRGASTISMQTARTVFLWPKRSFSRKIAEAYYTVLIEIFWGKKRILEVYLNSVDWGTGIWGAESAARTYFNVPCSRLSKSSAALLAAILPNPHKWSPTRPSDWVLMRKRRILEDMYMMPLIY
ncbi:monofunctional biosynthetic peptidoglycan transglycosylase [Thermodesulfobacteriota bacterium]